jgi:carotenoid cleavage dioxygenase-like enzyme
MSQSQSSAPSSSSADSSAPDLDPKSWWINAWRPSSTTGNYEITEIEGEVPRELAGTLYRNGPSQQVLPAEGHRALHLFDGDGMIHAFRFEEGRVFTTSAFAENPTFLREKELGRYAMGGVNLSVPEPDPVCPMRAQHNTNVVYHGGKLMALGENAWPWEMDARTLASIGDVTLGGPQLGMSVSAHPKIDGKTGQMLIHGYGPLEPYVQLYTVEPDGTSSLAEGIEFPYPVMMHDMAITENYVIFLVAPVVLDAERLIGGGNFNDSLSYQPELGLKFAIRRREAGSPLQWFEAPSPGFIFHSGNAYEEGGRIMMDACTYLNPPALLEALSGWRAGKVPADFVAHPFLYEFDLAKGTCSEKQLDDRGAEFPRMDDRLVGYKNRFGYSALDRGTGGSMENAWSTIVKYDRQGGPNVIHDFGRWQWPSEPVFAARTADSAEDDGFILNVVYDGNDDSSYLTILDARNLADAPLAKCRLRDRVPMGFHGNFVR